MTFKCSNQVVQAELQVPCKVLLKLHLKLEDKFLHKLFPLRFTAVNNQGIKTHISHIKQTLTTEPRGNQATRKYFLGIHALKIAL